MRIGFDVSQTAERMAGCGIVADQFLRHLVPASPSDVFIPYPVFGHYRNPGFAEATRPDGPNVVTDQFRLNWAEINQAWNAPADARAAFLGHPDVIHANNFSCPIDLPIPIVYTLYDMSQLECPEHHTERNRLVCVNGLFDASLHADRFVAISEHSRTRFLKWFPHVAPERVSVVYPAARPSISAPLTGEEVHSVLRTFDLVPDGFWLAVGTIEPRKNYALLLEAYAHLVAESPGHVLPLCIAGQAGWLESSLAPRIRQLGLDDHVRCLGFVEDAALAALYRACFAFVYPSLYEGFGLPVVEALSCGAAVVAMRSTSLPEVVGEAGILVASRSPAALLDAMRQLVLESGRRADLRAAAPQQAARFSWQRSAATLLGLYQSVSTGRSLPPRQPIIP
jgi:glycosyltransferase involved in cell wall biosynthesis